MLTTSNDQGSINSKFQNFYNCDSEYWVDIFAAFLKAYVQREPKYYPLKVQVDL